MSLPISSLWLSPPQDLTSRVETCIDAARDERESREGIVFFRADDVAVPGKGFTRLMELFIRRRTPLSLAVVPAWLSGPRWRRLRGFTRGRSSQWCWHQHGWRHINYEPTGKKQEFGPIRTGSLIQRDLVRGRRRLEALIGEDFYPVFTPPWNRCSLSTLILLKELGYHAVSRSDGSRPQPPDQLPDFHVNVDLHTRKEQRPVLGWDGLFKDLKQALISGFCGIMIHHQRMNRAAFEFLEVLLGVFSECKDLSLVQFKDLVRLSHSNRLEKNFRGEKSESC
jgi:peptidoglycan/xylan/chitin deacetylase (PgdA/CDA1 family)